MSGRFLALTLACCVSSAVLFSHVSLTDNLENNIDRLKFDTYRCRQTREDRIPLSVSRPVSPIARAGSPSGTSLKVFALVEEFIHVCQTAITRQIQSFLMNQEQISKTTETKWSLQMEFCLMVLISSKSDAISLSDHGWKKHYLLVLCLLFIVFF